MFPLLQTTNKNYTTLFFSRKCELEFWLQIPRICSRRCIAKSETPKALVTKIVIQYLFSLKGMISTYKLAQLG